MFNICELEVYSNDQQQGLPNEGVLVGNYNLPAGSDQEKVTVSAKQTKEAFVLQASPSKVTIYYYHYF